MMKKLLLISFIIGFGVSAQAEDQLDDTNMTTRPGNAFNIDGKLKGISNKYKLSMVAITKEGSFAYINDELVKQGAYIDDKFKLQEVKTDAVIITDGNANYSISVVTKRARYS